MDEIENYKLLKYVIIIQYCTKSVCVFFLEHPMFYVWQLLYNVRLSKGDRKG